MASQTLPHKEQNLSRQVVKFYEAKQHKKGTANVRHSLVNSNSS